jgi:hypothetical protein
MADMVFHMKTTLVIDDRVMTRLKEEAARRDTTISELVESALRAFLRKPRRRSDLPSLPSFDTGGALVDVNDRNRLYEAMEGE